MIRIEGEGIYMSVHADSTGPSPVLKLHFVIRKGISGVVNFIVRKQKCHEDRRFHEGKRHAGALSWKQTENNLLKKYDTKNRAISLDHGVGGPTTLYFIWFR